MNWIKQNAFLFGLSIATLVIAAALWVFGNSSASRYEESLGQYETAFDEASRFEKLDPYPNAEHLAGKKLAVEAYGEATEELQKAFGPYRPGELEKISVQGFSSAVKEANRETRDAFGPNAEIPDDYFCGFKKYKTALPPGNATGILNYQLNVTKKIMLKLADSGVTELVSLHRPELPEESDKSFKIEDEKVARALPLEIVFKGRESAVRDFLSSLANDKEHFLVVRSIRISNEKLIPPRKTDAKFSGGSSARPAGGGALGAPDFGALFDEANDQSEPAQGATPETAPAPEPQPIKLPSDSSRILAQVLGDEKLQVFVRLDVLLFLEPKELP